MKVSQHVTDKYLESNSMAPTMNRGLLTFYLVSCLLIPSTSYAHGEQLIYMFGAGMGIVTAINALICFRSKIPAVRWSFLLNIPVFIVFPALFLDVEKAPFTEILRFIFPLALYLPLCHLGGLVLLKCYSFIKGKPS